MNNKYIDVNTHEFTLDCLATLDAKIAKQEKLISKLVRKNAKKSVAICLIGVAGYYAYKNLNNRISKLEKKEEKSEEQN